MLGKAILKEPDVILFPELPQPESMQLAIKQVAENQKQIYTRMIAKSALAGLVQLLPKYRESAGANRQAHYSCHLPKTGAASL